MRFRFVGKLSINDQDAKVPGFREISGKSTGLGLNATVIVDTNRTFVECMGFKNDVIKTMDTDNNKIEIPWDSRFSKESVDMVASYRKNVIKVNGNRHEFISEYDFVDYIRSNKSLFAEKKFIVTGQIKKNEYNGSLRDRFVIQSMYELTEDNDEKERLRIFGEFFFNNDGIDTADWHEQKKVMFNGYTREWVDKDHPKVYCPMSVTFDCSKVDFSNERHVKLASFKLRQMGVTLEDGKPKASLKKNAYYAQNIVCTYVNGAEEVEFDESQLTDIQKEMVVLGLKNVDDFRPSGSIYGERVIEFKLVDFDLRGNYKDGIVKLDTTAKEFEESIYIVYKEEDPEKDPFDGLPFSEDEKKVDEDDIFS